MDSDAMTSTINNMESNGNLLETANQVIASDQGLITMPTPRLSINDLQATPPNSLENARQILLAAIHNVSADLDKLEAEFCDGKSMNAAIGSSARAVTKLMKEVNLSWLTEPIHMERLVSRCLYHDERDLTDDLAHVKNIFEKTWKYVPERVKPIVESIGLISKYLGLYCPAVYSRENDPYIQVSLDYEHLCKTWTSDIKKYLRHVIDIESQFKAGKLYLDEMSQNTRELAMKTEAEDCPFAFAFYEACQCLRQSLKLQTDWLTYGGEYLKFLEGEMNDLVKRRNILQQKALKLQDFYNKENYRLETVKQERNEKHREQPHLQSKEMELLVRDELLLAKVGEMRLDFDIKEFRLAEMHRTINPRTADPSILESMSQLAEEVRVEGAQLAAIDKEMNLNKIKLRQIHEKQMNYREVDTRYMEMKEKTNGTRKAYTESRKELKLISHTIEQIRYMLQYLRTPDTAKMIFHNLPRRREALGISKAHGLNLPSDPDDLLDTVFKVLSEKIGNRWVHMYRLLPFHPARGHRTIEQDITQIQKDCIRDSQSKEIMKCLDRWRRFHTRAKASDLLEVLKGLGELDILARIDRLVNPPRPPTPQPEVFPKFLDDKLIPYYQAISRYDNARQSKKHSAAHPAARV